MKLLKIILTSITLLLPLSVNATYVTQSTIDNMSVGDSLYVATSDSNYGLSKYKLTSNGVGTYLKGKVVTSPLGTSYMHFSDNATSMTFTNGQNIIGWLYNGAPNNYTWTTDSFIGTDLIGFSMEYKKHFNFINLRLTKVSSVPIPTSLVLFLSSLSLLSISRRR